MTTTTSSETIFNTLTSATPFTKFDKELHTVYLPEVSEENNRDVWQITEAFKYYYGNREDKTWVCVPTGFYTDGASVPRLLWWFIPRWGNHGPAAVVHDYLCRYKKLYVDGVETRISRKIADHVFLEALKVSNVSAFKRYCMFYAVRAYAKIKGLK